MATAGSSLSGTLSSHKSGERVKRRGRERVRCTDNESKGRKTAVIEDILRSEHRGRERREKRWK